MKSCAHNEVRRKKIVAPFLKWYTKIIGHLMAAMAARLLHSADECNLIECHPLANNYCLFISEIRIHWIVRLM